MFQLASVLVFVLQFEGNADFLEFNVDYNVSYSHDIKTRENHHEKSSFVCFRSCFGEVTAELLKTSQ